MKAKHSYTGIWLLIVSALVIITVISFIDMDIKIGSYTVKKAPIRETLLAGNLDEGNMLSDDSSAADGTEELDFENNPAETDSLPQSLFIFGDSMTFNLALRLADYAKQNGHVINSVNWDSSNTKIWADSDTLLYYLDKFKPTQVFISLGSNELYFKKPDSRAPYIKRIIEMIDTIPYVWIGPPNWKEDTGLNDMLERMCAPGSFFRSAGMEFERKADHVHPTRKSSALWVDSIMRWLPKSSHPFIAELPSDSIGKSNPHIVFLKAKNK